MQDPVIHYLGGGGGGGPSLIEQMLIFHISIGISAVISA